MAVTLLASVAPAAFAAAPAAAVSPAVQQQPQVDQGQPQPPAPGEEVVGLRERSSTTYATEDPNRFRTEVASGPIHFREGEGWQRIERALRPVPGNRFSNGGRNDFVLSVAGNQQDRQLARLETKTGQAVAFGLEGARPGSAAPDPARGGQSMVYRSALPHVDVELTSLADSLKEVLVLNSAQAPSRYVFPLTLSGLTAEVAATGEVLYRDEAGEVAFTTPRPWMTDSTAGRERPGASSADAAFRLIEQPAGGQALELTLSAQWLSDPSRVFPVKVDPTISSSSKYGTPYFYRDTFYEQSNKSFAYTADPHLWAGTYHLSPHYRHRSYLAFGEGEKITPGDGKHYVYSAYFDAYQFKASNCQERRIYVHRVTQQWYTPDTYAGQFGPYTDSSMGATLPAGTCPTNGYGWLKFNVTSIARLWEDYDADNFGLALLADTQYGDSERGFISQNHTDSALHPKLVVTWENSAPFAKAVGPASGTVVTASPDLLASHNDADGDWGIVDFQVERQNPDKTWSPYRTKSGCCGTEPNSVVAWNPSTTPGVYRWRAKTRDVATSSSFSAFPWSTFVHEVTPATRPDIRSSTHPNESTWYNDSTAALNWDPPLNYSGIAGYSYVLDRSPTTDPGQSVNNTDGTASPTLADGVSYAHVRAKNNAEQWSEPDHFTLRVDTGTPTTPAPSAPALPTGQTCFSDNTVPISWSASSSVSGIARYYWKTDGASGTTPQDTDTRTPYRTATTPALPDGTSYFHVKAKNWAGTDSRAGHVQLRVDSTRPGPFQVTSSSHPDQNQAYDNTTVDLAWPAADATCGIWDYSYVLDQTPTTVPDTTQRSSASSGRFTAGTASNAVVRGKDNYFHVRARNRAGLWSDTMHFRLRIHGVAPPTPLKPDNTAIVPSATPTLEVGAVTPPPGSTSVSYKFQISTSGTSWTTPLIDGAWQTGTTFSVPEGKLSPGTKYFWRAAAQENGGGTSPYFSPVWSFTVNSPPPPASAVSPEDQGTVPSTTPSLQVDPVTDQGQRVAYRFEVSAGSDFATVLADSGFITSTSYSVPAGSLQRGQTYFWRVATRDSLGATTGSAFVRSFTVQAQRPPALPSAPVPNHETVLPGSPGELSVAYSDPDGDSGTVAFELFSDDSGRSLGRATSSLTTSDGVARVNEPFLSGLVDGRYRWTAVATDSEGSSSDVATFTFVITSVAAHLGYGGQNGWAAQTNTALGNFVHTGTEVVLSTAGPELSAGRVYNSLTDIDTGFGLGWTHTFGVRWIGDPAGNVAIDWADGRREVHTRDRAGAYTPPKGFYSTLVPEGAGGFRLTLKDRSVYSFGADGRLLSITDASGRALALTYTAAGLDKVTDVASGRFLDYTVDGGLIRSVSTPPVDAHGGALTWQYGYQNGRLTSVCSPDSTTTAQVCWRYGYDTASGRLVSAITPRGNADTLVGYDGDGRVQHTENGTGDRTTMAYPATGKVVTTDPRGHQTTQQHDADFRLTSETDAKGFTTRYEYDDAGNRTLIADGLNQIATVAYDGRANPTRVTNPAGESTYSTFAEDLLTVSRDGRSASATDDAYRTDYGYDARRNRTSETGPPTADHGRITKTWTFSTGSEPAVGGGSVPPGLELSSTDGRGKTTSFGYDSKGDLRERRDPSGLTITYTYDELGRKLTETVADADAAALDTDNAAATEAVSSWTYDTHSNVATITGPPVANAVSGAVHQARTMHGYDANDNLTTETSSDLTGGDAERTVRHEFDNADREFRTVDAASGITARTFDRAGNPERVTDAEGRRYSVGYDARNQAETITLLGFVDKDGTTRDLTLGTFGYDAAGRRTSTTDALGRTTRQGYDKADRPTSTVLEGYDDRDGTVRTVTLSTTTYDRAGNAISTVTGGPRNPRRVDSTYDQAGWLTSSTLDPAALKRTTTFQRDRSGNETVQTRTAAGAARTEQVRSSYDDAARLIEQVTENGEVDLIVRRGYDQRGNLTSTTDPRGTAPGADAAAFTATVSYDSLGRPRRSTAPPVAVDDGSSDDAPAQTARPTAMTGYDTWGNPTHSADARGNVTVTRYDRLDRKTEVRHPAYTPPGLSALTPTESFGYDKVGNLTRQTSRRGAVTEWTFDALNRAVTQTDPAAEANTPRGVTRREYDDVGNVLAVVDPTGARTQTGYDDLNRPRTATQVVRDPDGTGPAIGGDFTTLTDYDDQGNVVFTRAATTYPDDPATPADESHADTTSTVNAAGETTGTVDATGASTRTDRDLAGRATSTVDALGRRTDIDYDQAGRPTATRRYDRNGALLTTSTSTPDPVGNVVAATRPRGNAPDADAGDFTTRRSYDALNRLLQVTVPVSGERAADLTTRYSYDQAGNHTRTVDGRGQHTRSTYGPWNLPDTTVEPATAEHSSAADRTWTFGYDAGGLAVTETQPGGNRVERSFDALARLTAETGGSDTEADAPAATRRFGYDLAGRRTSINHPDGTIALRYDDRSLLVATTGPAGQSQFGYDPDGRMILRQDAAGRAEYSWSRRGELVGAADSLSGQQRSWVFDPAGQVQTATSAGGTRRDYVHDDLGRLLSDVLVTDVPDTTDDPVRADHRYAYDPDGNVTAQTITYPAPPVAPGAVLPDPAQIAAAENAAEGRHAYCYDNAGRLVRWDKPLPTDLLAPDDADDCGAPDPIGDTADLTDYGYDQAGNRTKAGAQEFSYDERNRLATGPAGDYTWTARGTLTESTDGPQARSYTFDGLGRQVQAGTATYSYDALDRIAVRSTGSDTDQANSALFAYAGLEIDPVDDQVETDGALADLGSRYARSPAGRLLALTTNGSQPRQAVLNRHGDLAALTEPDGTITDTTVYDPFGQTSPDSTTGLTGTAAGFQGDWTDPETAQVWMGARWYQPANASFTRRDTYSGELTTPISLNRYTYAANNPLYYMDPDGRRPIASDDISSETPTQRAVSIAYTSGKKSGAALAGAHNAAFDAQVAKDPQVFLKQELRRFLPELSLLELEAAHGRGRGEPDSAYQQLVRIIADTYERNREAVLDHDAPVEFLRELVAKQAGSLSGLAQDYAGDGRYVAGQRDLLRAEAARTPTRISNRTKAELASATPGAGIPLDLALTADSLANGNYGTAAVDAIGIIPVFGDAAKLGIRHSDEILGGLRGLLRGADEAPVTAGIRGSQPTRIDIPTAAAPAPAAARAPAPVSAPAPARAAEAAPNRAPCDLYCFGNRSQPRKPRPGHDIDVDAAGMVGPTRPPTGASAFGDPGQAPLTGHFHRIPAGTELPPGLRVVADGADVGGPNLPTHHTIYPAGPMSYDDFATQFLNLPWEYAGRK